MTEENVATFLGENSIATVEDFIAALPRLHKHYFVAIHESSSAARDFVSTSHPRIVSWGANARFIAAWGTNPSDPGYEQIEFLQPVAEEARWIAGVIDFSGVAPEISRPTTCSQCHGRLNRPIWGSNGIHHGTEDEDESSPVTQNAAELHRTMASSTDPRIATLARSRFNSYKGPRVPLGTGHLEAVNWEFGTQLVLRHAEVLFTDLRRRPNYQNVRTQALCATGGWDVLVTQFPKSAFNMALLSDSLQRTQGEDPRAQSSRRYGGGSLHLGTTVGFLMMHEAWSTDNGVASLYRRTSNTDMQTDSSDRFELDRLHHAPGAASAEEELTVAYNAFFTLTGQASIEERARRLLPVRYGASFLHSHFVGFRRAVCQAIGDNGGQPPGGSSGGSPAPPTSGPPAAPEPQPEPEPEPKPVPPTASFEFGAECDDHYCRVPTDTPVSFVDTSSGTVGSRSWDFGDGGSSGHHAPRKTWRSPGFYTVVLTVSDGQHTSTASRIVLVEAADPAGACVSDAVTRCLGDSRYAVRVQWQQSDGTVGDGKVVPAGTNDSGLFRFFDLDNWEVLVKVLDGCSMNGRHWVFGASTTDLGYSITVTDTVTSESREYRNEPGTPAPAINDVTAFSTPCENR